MDNKLKHKYDKRAELVKAMAHPSRLLIVDKLAEKEYCVQELTGMVGDDISTVSKHLSVLRNAGIVKGEKRGSSVYYSLNCPCVMRFFDCVESMISK